MVCRLAAPATGSGNLPAPVELRTRTQTTHSVRLHWVDPSLDQTQRIADERYYNVYYHAVPHGKNLSVIVKALHVTLHDLEPGHRYRFKVRTVKGVDTSPFSDTITDRTLTGRQAYGYLQPISRNFPIGDVRRSIKLATRGQYLALSKT